MKKQHDQEFKENAVKYYNEHQDLGLEECAKNLGIGNSTLSKWRKLFNENGMLRKLDVSRSGYNDWLHREPSEQKKRKQRVKQQIQLIYDQSCQNYGAPKICNRLQYDNEIITERTVGKYMKEMGLRAQYVKPYVKTTKDSNFSNKLENILNEQFNPIDQTAYGAQT